MKYDSYLFEQVLVLCGILPLAARFSENDALSRQTVVGGRAPEGHETTKLAPKAPKLTPAAFRVHIVVSKLRSRPPTDL
jgi:hypothetical protein